jgi:multidrug resistance efflux pump
MSEFHPNRTKQIRTRPKLTTRRIIECWPLLVWIAMAVLAWRIYASGVTFARMNGAVDVYQENLTPVNDGRLMKIEVRRGDRVKPGDVVALMDPSDFNLEMESHARDIVADRTSEIRDFESDLLKLESEMRELQTQNSEDASVIKSLESQLSAPKGGNLPPALVAAMGAESLRANLELAKAKGRDALNASHRAAVQEDIDRIKKFRDTLAAEAALITKHGLASPEVLKANSLRDDEMQKYLEIKNNIEHCSLRTSHGGIVDRIEKEIGEFVKTGESVLKVVGDPENIVCFLPQDQASDVAVNDTVWVANTSNKAQIFPATVTGVSPRINNLADATSPLPNRRVHGRDILVAYPRDAIVNGKPLLLPGQTVIVHLEKPGSPNWFNTILHNDDNDSVR